MHYYGIVDAGNKHFVVVKFGRVRKREKQFYLQQFVHGPYIFLNGTILDENIQAIIEEKKNKEG